MLSEVRQTLYDFTSMCNLKKISKKKNKTETDPQIHRTNIWAARGEGMGRQTTQAKGIEFSSHKINQLEGDNIYIGIIVNNTATTLYVTYGNWTNFDDHFIMHENINSLYYIPNTNILS